MKHAKGSKVQILLSSGHLSLKYDLKNLKLNPKIS